MFKKIFIAGLAILGVILLFATSEVIYIYNNRPSLIETYYIWRAQMIADKDPQKAVNFLLAGSNKYKNVSENNFNPYPAEFSKTKIELPENENLARDFKNYIKTPELIRLYEYRYYSYPRIFYDLALIAYKNEEPKTFTELIQIATINDPSLSYWAVELANYHHATGRLKEAFEILQTCQKIETARDYCKEIEETLLRYKQAHPTGFLKDGVEKIYQHESIKY